MRREGQGAVGSGEAAVKGGTSLVRAEGSAEAGQAARERFVQREEGTQGANAQGVKGCDEGWSVGWGWVVCVGESV